MEDNQHPVLSNLRRQIELLKLDNVTLQSEVNRLAVDHEQDVENVRLILIDAISNEQRYDVNVNSVSKSVADVLGISLQKEITISIPLTVEATMLVPANFDVRDLDIHDVGMDAFNTDVEDFNVQSWDIGHIEEM
jgi:hypothetical protein